MSKEDLDEIKQQMKRDKEFLVEQLSLVRASLAACAFIQISIKEDLGGNGNAILEAVDKMQTTLLNGIESQMRNQCGLPQRDMPHEPSLKNLKDQQWQEIFGTNDPVH